MAKRPLAFGVRMRGRGRTLRVRGSARRYVLEVEKAGRSRRREHASLLGALRDCARLWRSGLH